MSGYLGAAFVRTRKVVDGLGSGSGSDCFNGAAFVRTRKEATSTSCCKCWRRLQWGRVRANAERRCGFSTGAFRRTLQWGRVRANAESCGPVGGSDARPVASMGPRSCERGKWSFLKPEATIATGFNGAAFVRTRKALRPRTCPALGRRFNGAAFVRTRKVRRFSSILGTASCFNGAAFVRTRKGSFRCLVSTP